MLIPAVMAAATAAGLVLSTPAQAISGGTAAPDGTYAFTGRLDVGQPGIDGRACSATLIDPSWIITTSTCFADTSLHSGPPPKPATVTFSRATPTSTRAVRGVSYLIPRTDRNVTLALLDTPVTGITPAPLGSTGPVVGESLTGVGYGRTSDTWLPEQARIASFTVNATTGTTATLTGANGVDTCKGDAGGPALRQSAAKTELVAVHSTSWQHGCLTVGETRQGSVESRVDDLTGWVQQQLASTPIRNADGLCMDLGANDPGTKVVTTTCRAGNTSQQWRTLPDGTIRNYNGLALDIGSNAEGTPVIIATARPGNTSQHWTRPDGTIRNYNGLCADLGANAPGTTVVIAPCRGGAASQQWSVGDLHEVSGKIRNHNGLCADLSSNKPGTIVGMTACRPAEWASQHWSAPIDGTLRNTNGLCMDLGANDPGTTVGMTACQASNPSQQWRVMADGTIRNYNSLVMDLGSNAEGTPVIIATARPGNTSQQWTLGG
ncbi:ricin-type beta-trefoil lectin domain protein [Amycolatopsis sp. PS_44_ISF1]|uniref:ricin-type beta-trefoil lectin domain protein n=1 Tax=Amycolatopsis sp. PS_44_ISF1 TaxID=2974917 RepID=UPI0028DF8661|nr:ricin-type beta-trefoil lectin domain protein [Amycolatopsis sp. PS_44_ISF1]MDT8915120.1 ricin-type beta-trefoil lectin domain protein [Amycolatopsis sp. PS_44_ISF1]